MQWYIARYLSRFARKLTLVAVPIPPEDLRLLSVLDVVWTSYRIALRIARCGILQNINNVMMKQVG